MAAITRGDIQVTPTNVYVIDRIAESNGMVKPLSASTNSLTVVQYDQSFGNLVGPAPTYSLLLSSAESSNNPFFHEACVFLPNHDELYMTSNLLQSTSSARYPTILISRVKLHRPNGHIHTVEWVKLRPPLGIDMPKGGVNYKDGILFCAQGAEKEGTGGVYYMPRKTPPIPVVTNFHGRDFNSVNDVVVAKDGAIWFTDPSYGNEQDFRPKPKLPNQVYRYDPLDGNIRVMADGFGMPNGICFSPSHDMVYVTDTDIAHFDGSKLKHDAKKSGAPFLVNRRVFAFAAVGSPHSIKCDIFGHVYAGCSDGIEVWNQAGALIGKILVPGGVANFCFGKEGEIFLCANTRLWRVQLAASTKGALLNI